MTTSTEYEADKILDLSYREIIENTILAALDYEGCPYKAEVNVTLTDNDTIQEINREHRRIDVPMDVLPFPVVDYESPSDFDRVEEAAEDHFNPETGELILGDIVISVNKVGEQVEEYDHSRIRELALLTAHNISHLFGYDHMEGDERLMMEEKQEEILEARGYTR